MHAFILTGLMACLATQPAVAESTVAEIYNTYITKQAADHNTLVKLDEAVWMILSKLDYFSQASPAEQELLVKNAREILSIIEQIRTRGETAFDTIEGQYELYCHYGSPYLFLCARHKKYYKMIIVDTIVYGGAYSELNEFYSYLVSVLGK